MEQRVTEGIYYEIQVSSILDTHRKTISKLWEIKWQFDGFAEDLEGKKSDTFDTFTI